jgi:hypothetical protein
LAHSSLKGFKFNFWTVVGDPIPGKRQYSLCRCECGLEKIVEHCHLKSGKSKSCRKCSASRVATLYLRKPGLDTKSKEYRAWCSMKTRCYNPNAVKCFEYHGKKGIQVCNEWLHDFEAFYAYIGDAPSPKHSVDRISSAGSYEPGNVRWATKREQVLNRSCVKSRNSKENSSN